MHLAAKESHYLIYTIMNQKDKSNWEKVKVKMNVSGGNEEQNTNAGKVKVEKDKDDKIEKIGITSERCKK